MTVTAADDLYHEWLTTCVHEAGHATAYVVHGQPFKAVKVWEVDGLVYGVTESPDACEMGARELIVSNWPMVLMIAAALIEHEVLTYDEVCALVAVSDTP